LPRGLHDGPLHAAITEDAGDPAEPVRAVGGGAVPPVGWMSGDVFGTNAADTERFPVVRMLHVVGVPNLLRFAHLANGIRGIEVVDG